MNFMEPNAFGSGFEILWSAGAIVGGMILIFFRKWFTKSNSRALFNLYKKTNFHPFEIQSREMSRPYMDILVPILGVAFVVVGFVTLIKNL